MERVAVERTHDAGGNGTRGRRIIEVPGADIGEARCDRLSAAGAFDVALADATRAWRDAIPSALGAEAVAP